MMAKVVDIEREFRPTHLAGAPPQPHRVKQFKLSTDPHFVDKLHDIVGLYLDPPATPSSSRWTKRAKSRRWTALSPACR